MQQPFSKFPKIARLSRPCVITEKIDGTNASIFIDEDGEFSTGSRNRWITPEDDNYGFSRWAVAHKKELMLLGPGHHFGEWWGQGIQRRYDLDEKRFSLFNVHRWAGNPDLPECCHVVPVIVELPVLDTNAVIAALCDLSKDGSVAAPGFMNPEGIVIYHAASRQLFKKTIIGDAEHKNQRKSSIRKPDVKEESN